MTIGDFNICEPEEGGFSVRNQTFTESDAGKTALLRTFFPHALEIAQKNFTRKDTAAGGTLRTLSRIDRALSMCPWRRHVIFTATLVTGNLGKRSIPSDRVAIRVVIHKPLDYCSTDKRIPSWRSKHSVLCTILKQISDDHHFTDEPFAALADFKLIIDKARKRTRHELLRNTLGSPSTKLLIAAVVMRACRN